MSQLNNFEIYSSEYTISFWETTQILAKRNNWFNQKKSDLSYYSSSRWKLSINQYKYWNPNFNGKWSGYPAWITMVAWFYRGLDLNMIREFYDDEVLFCANDPAYAINLQAAYDIDDYGISCDMNAISIGSRRYSSM